MMALLDQCKFHNCKHINEPGCEVLNQLNLGNLSNSRYQSYLSMYQDDPKIITVKIYIMRAIIQRVNHASVKVENEYVCKIKEGLLVLIGFEVSDDIADIQWVIKK